MNFSSIQYWQLRFLSTSIIISLAGHIIFAAGAVALLVIATLRLKKEGLPVVSTTM
jgi:hypothetical protein